MWNPEADRKQDSPRPPPSPGGWRERAEAALGRPGVRWTLLGLLVAGYTLAVFTHPLSPRAAPVSSREGWWSWSDQFEYWKTAAAMAHGQLAPASYRYPPGYPALGALGWKLCPTHPFFLPNLALVVGTAMVAWRLARRFLSRSESLAASVVFLAVHLHTLGLTVVVPWNTILTQGTLLAGILCVMTVAGPRAVLALAVLAGVTYTARPVDAVSFAPLLTLAALRLPNWPDRLRWGAVGAAVIAAAVIGVALLNQAVHGAWRTPYEKMSVEGIGFFSYPPAFKLYWLLFDGHSFFGGSDTALLFRYPWLFFAVPGVLFWLERDRLAAAASLTAMGLSACLYFNYNDFLPSDVFRFTLIHYVAWIAIPLWIHLAAGLLRGLRRPCVQWGLVSGAAILVLGIGLQLRERTLMVYTSPGRAAPLPAVRPLWVRFPDASLGVAGRLHLDGREMREAADYQIPYVPSDLRLLLSEQARGCSLSAPIDAGVTVAPLVGDFVWGWKMDFRRLRAFFGAQRPAEESWNPAADQSQKDSAALVAAEGWFGFERDPVDSWRWSGRRGVIQVAPLGDRTEAAALIFRVQVVRSCRIAAAIGEKTIWEAELAAGAETSARIPIVRGRASIDVVFCINRAPRVAGQMDPRRIGFRLLDVKLVAERESGKQ